MATVPTLTSGTLEPVARLVKDIRKAAVQLGPAEARFLVDGYYQIQEQRKRTANQLRSTEDSGEPNDVLRWYVQQWRVLENSIRAALDEYSNGTQLGLWAKSLCGVGPVITAGLMAHIDVTKPTAGDLWSFAGLNPAQVWKKGQKRPHNADLKKLCYNIGECFIRAQGRDNDIYGQRFAARKDYEIAENQKGNLSKQAKERAEQFRTWGKTHSEAYRWYTGHYPPEMWDGYLELSLSDRQKRQRAMDLGAGNGLEMLPPAHIHARARRWIVKMFLSHWHTVGYFLAKGGLPLRPYTFDRMAGHTHLVWPPNAELIPRLVEALQKWQ